MLNGDHEAHLPKLIDIGAGLAPASPQKLTDCGFDSSLLVDLALRTGHMLPQFTTEQMTARMHLPHSLVNELLEQLRKDSLLEVHGQEGHFSYRYSVSGRGRERADRLMHICGYTGPAPVSLDAYTAMLQWQAEQNPSPSPEDVKKALSELVLTDHAMLVAGLAISSGRSLFVSGPPGNGKTTLGHLLNKTAGAEMWIPYSIAIDNFNIIRLYDTHCHEIVDHGAAQVDKRWVKIKRPFIVAGGEMTLASLDLAYLPALHYYEAPLHMKANGGTFLIDDFGRQQVAPAELLNRWIIPLEHHIDFLTLHTGQKIEVPFLLMLIIATNLNPKDVTDPAFLRRIGYRMQLSAPTPEAYAEIFRQYAARCGVQNVDPHVIKWLLERYRSTGRELRACEPRDLILRATDICNYRKQELALTDDVLKLAWDGYFSEAA